MEQCPDKRTTVAMLDVLHGMESRWRSPTQMYWIDLHGPFTGALSTSKSCNWINAYIMCRLYQHDSDSGCTAIVHQHCYCIREMVRWTWFERDVNDRKTKCMVLYHASHHSTWAVQNEIENATVARVLRSAGLCMFMHFKCFFGWPAVCDSWIDIVKGARWIARALFKAMGFWFVSHRQTSAVGRFAVEIWEIHGNTLSIISYW